MYKRRIVSLLLNIPLFKIVTRFFWKFIIVNERKNIIAIYFLFYSFRDISNKRSKNDKPPSGKKIKTENNEDITTTLVSLTKVAEKILDKNKSDKENQAPGNDNSTFINYISSQLDNLPKKKRQELEAKISVLVNNVVLEEMSKDDQQVLLFSFKKIFNFTYFLI